MPGMQRLTGPMRGRAQMLDWAALSVRLSVRGVHPAGEADSALRLQTRTTASPPRPRTGGSTPSCPWGTCAARGLGSWTTTRTSRSGWWLRQAPSNYFFIEIF